VVFPEESLDDLNALVSPWIGAATIALAVLGLVLLVLVIMLARRASRFERRLAGLTRGADGQSLESILDAHLEQVHALSREVDELAARSAVLEATQRRAFQRIGLVRFNPFEDTGGNQSFALALLDEHGDGFVVSSLHARAGTRVYGKAITKGASESNLSEEEAEALRIALAPGSGTGKGG
jgi:predicted ferric reductase